MNQADEKFIGVPWKDGGRNSGGADCVGLTCMFLERETGFAAPVPSSDTKSEDLEGLLAGFKFDEKALKRGDVIFFRHVVGRHMGEIRHVAVWLGGGKLLHTFKGTPSRIENGLRLAQRVGLDPIAAVPAKESEILARALADKNLKMPVAFALVGLIVAFGVSQLMRPKKPAQGNKDGKYSFNGLVTQNSPEIPLADVLGSVTLAGNSPYTQVADKSQTVSHEEQQAVNKIVVFCGGPMLGIDIAGLNLLINGATFNTAKFYQGTNVSGIYPITDLTDLGAVNGTLAGNTYVPSMTLFNGDYDVSVPVAIAAQYDRSFPVYGYAGCCYMVFRLFNAANFSTFNINATVKGRLLRTYNSSGFITATSTAEAVGTGDGTTVRFKLLFQDIVSVSSVTVGGTTYNQINPVNQLTGNLYNLNATKGFIEFITAPAAAAAIVVTYAYYPRAFTQCPADHLVYLLTENTRGKGLDASRIDWVRAVAFQTFCNATVTWTNSSGTTTGPRYTSNYSVDSRKPIQDHMQAILDACNAYLFISNGKFVIKARAQDTSIFSFNEGNILAESFSSSMVDRADRPNLIQLFYHDQSAYNSETEVDVGDAADQAARSARVGNDGVVPMTLKFTAVDNGPQAERIGQTILSESINSLWMVSFKTTILGLAVEPGDIVDVTHSSQPAWNQKLFRVENIGIGDDDRIELQLTEYFDGAYV